MTRRQRRPAPPRDPRRPERAELHVLRDDEGELLERVTARIGELDPDVIEGHNLFNFDLPYMVARADRHGVPLTWGRDGSEVRLGAGQARFKAGPGVFKSL